MSRSAVRLTRCQAAAVSVDLELLDQTAQLCRGLYQLLRCLLRVPGSARSALCRLRDAGNVAGDFPASMRSLAYIARHLVGSRVLLLYRGRNRARDVVDLVDHSADRGDRVDGCFGVGLDGFNFAAYVFRGFGGLFGQFFHFIGDHREAFACFARAGSFNRGVQSQQIGLLRNRSNDFDDLPNLGGSVAQIGNGGGGGFRNLDGRGRDLGSLGGIFSDLFDAGAHFLCAGGYGLQILTDLLGGSGNHFGLGRGFLRVGRDLLAGRGQVSACSGYALSRLGDLGQDTVYLLDKEIKALPQFSDFVLAVLVHSRRQVIGFRHLPELGGE